MIQVRGRSHGPLFGRPWLGGLVAGLLLVLALVILLGPRPAAPVVDSPATEPSWPIVSAPVMPEDIGR